MSYNDYIYQLSMMLAWFNAHLSDVPKYYEFTMRYLITEYSYNELINNRVLSENVENNVIRLIEDNKIFIVEHLERIGIIKNTINFMDSYSVLP